MTRPANSSKKLSLTVLIAARNEEANLGRCLAALVPAKRVVVLDSHSTDRTAEIARSHGAEVVQFDYAGGYPKKRQWALDHLEIGTDWVLLLDADEVVPAALWEEIDQALRNEDGTEAYLITKGFHFLGRRLRFGGFSHSAVLLFRRGMARFEHLIDDPANAQDMEVHERLQVKGTIRRLETPLIHQDFKGLKAYIDRHNHYSTWEARVRRSYLNGKDYGHSTIRPRLFGNAQERRRWLKLIAIRVPGEPLWWFLYHFVIRLGFLEGQAGWIASHIRASYIAQARAKCYELVLAEQATEGSEATASSPKLPSNAVPRPASSITRPNCA